MEVADMQFKKVGKIAAAGTLAALMMGSSVSLAALDAYPAPFVTSDGVQSLVVLGSQGTDPVGLASDIAGAVDIAARLGGEVTTELNIPGVAGVVNIAGEGKEIGTKSQPIFLGTNLATNGLRSTMTDTDLPTVLMSGSVEDTDANDEYDYDQFIQFSNDFPLIYSRASGEEADPSYKFGEFTTSASSTNNFYKLQIIFTDEVNMTTVVSEEIDLFGGSYTFAPDTSSSCTGASSQVVLFGSSDKKLLAEGEEVTVTVGGVTHTVKLLVVSDSDTVAVSVDGQSKSLDKGQSSTVSGVSIFVDDVFFSSKEGTISSADIGLGAREITFLDTSQIEVGLGGSIDFIDGSLVDLTCSNGKLTKLDVFVTAADSDGDYLREGSTFEDPIFGSFRVAFPAVLPTISDTTNREEILVTPSGNNDVDLTMTTDRGDKKTIKFVHANSTSATNGGLILSDDNSDEIVVVEGAPFTRDDYFVADAGEFSRMFEITGVSSMGTANSELRIRDVFSGDTTEIALGTDDAAEKVIDGQSYFFNLTGTTSAPVISVTWGDGADQNRDAADPTGTLSDPGDFITVYPVLKTKMNDEGVALQENVTLAGLTDGAYLINLPTGTIGVFLSGTAAGINVTANTTEKSEASAITNVVGDNQLVTGETYSFRLGKTSTGGANYNVAYTDAGATGTLVIGPANAAGASISEPVVLLVEEENDDGNVGSVAFSTSWDDTNDETDVGAPIISSINGASSNSGTRESDTDVTRYVSRWGTWIERDTEDQARVTVKYPDEEVTAALVVLANDATATIGGGSAGQSIKSAVPIKTSIAKLDREVTASDRSNKHLVLVGGPVVNSLVGELASSGKTWTADQYRAQGAGTAVLNLVESAFTPGRSALVVAGYGAADTRTVASVLQNFDAHESALMGKNLVVWKNGVVTSVTA
jgi:hypothetical protein